MQSGVRRNEAVGINYRTVRKENGAKMIREQRKRVKTTQDVWQVNENNSKQKRRKAQWLATVDVKLQL